MATTTIRHDPSRGMPTYTGIVPLAIGVGLISSIAMFAAGFGALLLFWEHSPHDSSIPGLFDYRAATWGDGLFLSVGCGALAGCLWQRWADGRVSRREVAHAAGAGVIGLLAGVGIQCSWIASDETLPNWTIPQPHHFTAAGWYHAAYFAACFGFFAFTLALVVRTKIASPGRTSSMERICEFLITFSVCGYLCMHLADDHADALPKLMPVGIAPLVVAIPLLAICLAVRGRDTALPTPLLGGCSLASGLCACILRDAAPDAMMVWLAVSVAFVCSCVALPSRHRIDPDGWRLACALLSQLGVALTLQCAIGLPLCMALLCAVVPATMALTAALTQEPLIKSDLDRAAVSLLLAGLSQVFGVVYRVGLFDMDTLGEIVYSIIVALAAACVRNAVTVLHDREGMAHGNGVKGARTHPQMLVYASLALIIVGLASMLSLDLVGSDGAGGTRSLGSSSLARTSLMALLPTLLVIAYAALGRKPNIRATLQRIVGLVFYATLYACVTGLRKPLVSGPVIFIELFLAPGSGMFVAESFASNVALIRGRKLGKRSLLDTAIIAVGGAAVVFGSTVPTQGVGGAFAPTVLSPLVGVLGMVAGLVVFPCVVVTYGPEESYRQGGFGVSVKNTPSEGVRQNGVAACAIAGLAGAFGLGFIESNLARGGASHFLQTSVALILILGGATTAIVFPLKNNVRFLRRAIGERDELSGKERARADAELLPLVRHFQRQAYLTLYALMPASLLIVPYEFLKEGSDNFLSSLDDELLLALSPRRFAVFGELVPAVSNYAGLNQLSDAIIDRQRKEL